MNSSARCDTRISQSAAEAGHQRILRCRHIDAGSQVGERIINTEVRWYNAHITVVMHFLDHIIEYTGIKVQTSEVGNGILAWFELPFYPRVSRGFRCGGPSGEKPRKE